MNKKINNFFKILLSLFLKFIGNLILFCICLAILFFAGYCLVTYGINFATFAIFIVCMIVIVLFIQLVK